MKVVLIGDSAVGKSALVYRFIHNQRLSETKATVGIAFFKQQIPHPQTGEEIPLQIWDTAGQEKFQSVTTHHYREADGALLVFDVGNEASFLNVGRWLNDIRENTDPGTVVCLVATKMDRAQPPTGKRVVSQEQAMAFARQHLLIYAETSAYWDRRQPPPVQGSTMMGIELVFQYLVKTIVQQKQDLGNYNPGRLDNGSRGSLRLGDESSRSKSSECPC